MKLGKRNPLPGRQRHQDRDELVPRSTGYAYRANRSEQTLNVGRKIERTNAASVQVRTSSFWLQRMGLIVLLIAVVASLVNIISLSSTAEIRAISSDTSGGQLFDAARYQSAVNHMLASSLWNHNKITVDTAKISRNLLAEFPDIASVSVTIPVLTHHPIVYIEPAQPVLIIQSATSGSFVLDASGKALLKNTANPISPGTPVLPVLTDLSGLTLHLGEQVLSGNSVNFIHTVVAELAAKDSPVASMTLPAATSELDVKVVGQNYVIKFNLESNDPAQQVGTYLATIANLTSQHITPAQYIDVRVDGRAYYQ